MPKLSSISKINLAFTSGWADLSTARRETVCMTFEEFTETYNVHGDGWLKIVPACEDVGIINMPTDNSKYNTHN